MKTLWKQELIFVFKKAFLSSERFSFLHWNNKTYKVFINETFWFKEFFFSLGSYFALLNYLPMLFIILKA